MKLRPDTSFVRGFASGNIATLTTNAQSYTTDTKRGQVYGVALLLNTNTVTSLGLMSVIIDVNGQVVQWDSTGFEFFNNNPGRVLFSEISAPGGSVVNVRFSNQGPSTEKYTLIVLHHD